MNLTLIYAKLKGRFIVVSKLGFLVVRLTFLTFFILFFSVLSAPVCAEVVPGTSCDVEVYDVLSERAWLEGQREVEVAQQLILKPDSVLEYSCFQQRRNELRALGMDWSGSGGLSFGEITRLIGELIGVAAAQAFLLGDTESFNNIIDDVGDIAFDGILAELGVDSLEALIDNPLQNYLTDNFYHTLAGGTYDQGAVGLCDAMNVVWNFMKCSNFDEETFYTLDQLTTSDFRTLPQQCSVTTRAQRLVDAIDVAYPEPTSPASLGGMDAVNLRLPMLTQCGAPIPTGLTVFSSPPGDYDPEIETKQGRYIDKVCSAPGCYFLPHRLGTGDGICTR